MPINLLIAYGIFCSVPLVMALVFAVRRRAIEHRLKQQRPDRVDGRVDGAEL